MREKLGCADCKWRTWILTDDGVKPCTCRQRNATPSAKLRRLGISSQDIESAETLPIDVQVARITESMLARVDDGLSNYTESLLFVGPVGVGKSLLVLRMMLRAVEMRPATTLGYVYLPRLFVKIKSTFGREGALTEEEVIEPLVKPDLVVLDDLGAEHGSEWATTIVTMLVHERAQKSTLITTNLELEADPELQKGDNGYGESIEEVFEMRLVSRLTPYRRIPIDGDGVTDLRKKYRLRQ